MSNDPSTPPESGLAGTLRQLEQRLARIEQHLQLPPLSPTAPSTIETKTAITNSPTIAAVVEPPAEELEYVVGQNWFAIVGVMVLTCGVGFSLSLPWSDLPAIAPSALGYVLSISLLVVARIGRKSFELVSRYLRGAGIALLFFSTLRLFFFGASPALDLDGPPGRAVLAATVGVILFIALRQKSPGLIGLGILMGLVATIAIGTPFVVICGVLLLSGLAAFSAVRWDWPALLPAAIPACYVTHLLWVINRPWSGRPYKIVAEPAAAIFALLAYAVIFALGSLRRRDRTKEDLLTILAVVLNCAAGYGLFLIQSVGANSDLFVQAHFIAAVVFLGLAATFWQCETSLISTFFYAMTGYFALSVAIVKHFPAPNVFIWLSWESLLVVITALWFRSRFIVVANFLIYVLVVFAYMLTAKIETGISVGFGVVALITARILNWKKARLELKTDLMRNAYLASAFVMFPYALYYLVPRGFISLSWVGVALAYYAMNLIVRNPKYRWMGHMTLLLTVVYVVIVSVTQLGATYRIISFLVLGTVLLAVSLIFTQVRSRRKPTDDINSGQSNG